MASLTLRKKVEPAWGGLTLTPKADRGNAAGTWLPDSVRAQMEVKTPAVSVAKPATTHPAATGGMTLPMPGYERERDALSRGVSLPMARMQAAANTTASLTRQAAAVARELDAAQKKRAQLIPVQTMQGSYVDYPVTVTHERNAELAAADKEIAALNARKAGIGARYYEAENREKLGKIGADAKLFSSYEDAKSRQSDIDRLNRLMSMQPTTEEEGAKLIAEQEYFHEKFGAAYGDLSGYSDLLNQLSEEMGSVRSALFDSGVSFPRVNRYEKKKVEAAQREKELAETKKLADEHPVPSSVASIIASPAQGLDFLGNMMKYAGKSDLGNLDSYEPMYTTDFPVSNFVSTVRGTVSKKIEENTDWEIYGQNVASFLYNTGMSVGDSVTQIAALGPFATYVMGMSAASNGARDVVARGGSNGQAFTAGLASGAAEAVFEKFSIDNLLTPRSVDSVKRLIMETAKQAGVEASEEMFTEIANMLSDAAIMGQNSNFNNAVRGYMADGLSEEEAKQKAYLDNVAQVAWSGAGGALSGGFMGGAVNGMNYAGSRGSGQTVSAPMDVVGQQKTASTGETEKINPGARQTIREQLGDMPSQSYDIPRLTMPLEVMVDTDGNAVTEGKLPAAIRKYMARIFKGKVLQVGADHKVYIDKNGIEEFTFPVKRIDAGLKTAKMAAGANLDATLNPAVFLLNMTDDGHHPEATGGWDNFYVMFETDTGVYSGIVKTKATERGKVFHDITEIQKEGDPVSARGDNGTSPPPAWTQSPSSDPTIAPGGGGVKVEDMQRGLGVYAPPGESIDSLIERMYNETEPDHFEITEMPGELPVIDEDYFTQWEATPHGGEEAGAADGGAVYGADVRGETGETGVYPGRTGAISEAANGLRSGESRTEGGREIQRWAKGYVIQQPDGAGLRQALEKMKAYTPDVVVVADSTLKGRNSSALAVTSDGVIYLSDAIPDNLSQVVPFHEVVHVAKQNGNRDYMAFLNTLGEKINIAKTPSRVLNIVIESRFPGKTLFDLSSAQLDTVYDELNALVWGYHKADAANARAQFAEMFIDYDAYISELDAIMEVSRKNVLEVPESVDSLIEQAYNETEPDHSEVFEVPERILPRERELIDEEWSGGASDFGTAPVPVKEAATFETKIPAYSPPVNQSISKAARHTVFKGAEHRGEHLVLVDSLTGEWVFEDAGDDRSVGNSGAFREFVKQHPQGRYTYVHSHPSGMPFSLNDMAEFFGADQFESMVAAGYNGKVYTVYGKRARVSVWNEISKPEVDIPLLKDLRKQYRNGEIDTAVFQLKAEYFKVQYLQEQFCSVWEEET